MIVSGTWRLAASRLRARPPTVSARRGRGSFAKTQATFMTPDLSIVRDLDASLSDKNMGVVAHYYMDAELQVRWSMALTFVGTERRLGEGARSSGWMQNGLQ